MLAVFGENLRQYSDWVLEVIRLFSGSTVFDQLSRSLQANLGSIQAEFWQVSCSFHGLNSVSV
jgi:hypothetical protein